ncbi:hypothetical protein EYF80_016649 [Liparis tanakae]|uniref:Uncharacterized protein n=1 Tax=Liparis tanakae TaxID=230148 RepID=A0A4Z2I7L6_9TELE|nr:hypothetical protein EYF80_016649 [Liparis tanakae]
MLSALSVAEFCRTDAARFAASKRFRASCRCLSTAESTLRSFPADSLGLLVFFGLLLHLLTPALHAPRLRLQQLLEPVAVSEARWRAGLSDVSLGAAVSRLQAGVGRRQRGGVQSRVQSHLGRA